MFVLNTSFGIKLAWKVIEGFMAVHMKNKMMLSDKNTNDELLNMFHPSQLEKKFGGAAENVTVYWPPVMPSKTFGQNNDSIVSQNEYDNIISRNKQLKCKEKIENTKKKTFKNLNRITNNEYVQDLDSNEISEMEINSSNYIQRHSLSINSKRCYSDIVHHNEKSVHMEYSELLDTYHNVNKFGQNILKVNSNYYSLILLSIGLL